MAEEKRSLNFIEQFIEEDLKNDYNERRFAVSGFRRSQTDIFTLAMLLPFASILDLGENYNAPVNLRFDDTNPIKEEQEYVDAIKQ